MGNGLGPISSTSDYDEKVTDYHGPVVVEFYDETSDHVQALNPWVKHLRSKHWEAVDFWEVNVRDAEMHELVTRYNITETPTFLLYSGKGNMRTHVNIGSNFASLEAAVEVMASPRKGLSLAASLS
ncbi:hypothetical protein BJY00DRAFT_288018, partial [Aspergillus carlsbadensis]